jgi:hypothetical protein
MMRTSSGSQPAGRRWRRWFAAAARTAFLAASSHSAGPQHQLAVWVVEDLEAEVAELRGRGVEFEEYD